MTEYTTPEESEMFDGSMLDELVDQSVAVKKSLNELVNKCWYTDELVVVHMQTPENLEIYQDYFLDNLGESFEVVTLDSHILLSSEEILRKVVHALFPDAVLEGGHEVLLGRLFQHVDQLAEESAELLIQINDAHQLALEVLRDLAEIVEGHATMVTPHILLWADQDSEEAFADSFADSEITVGTIAVPRFSPRELADYMKVVFRSFEEPFPFDKESLQQLIRQSRGVGSELDHIVHSLLTAGEEKETGRRRSLPLPQLAIGLAATIVLGVVFFFLQKPEPGTETDSTVVVDIPSRPAEVLSPTQTGVSDNSLDQSAAADGEAETEQVVARENIEPAGQRQFEVPQEAAVPQPGITQPEARNVLPEPEPVVMPEAQSEEPEVAIETPQPDLPAETVELQQEEVADTPVAESRSNTYQAQLDSLLAHPDSQAFIQLLGTYDESNARDFINDYAIDDRFYYFRTDLNGRDWFVVVYGGFVTERLAIEARDGLSAKLSEGGPWIRGMENIRNSIK